MIKLKRLNGSEFMLNSELILQMESRPDTVIMLNDGETKYIVADSIDEIYLKIVRYKADILCAARRSLKNKAEIS